MNVVLLFFLYVHSLIHLISLIFSFFFWLNFFFVSLHICKILCFRIKSINQSDYCTIDQDREQNKTEKKFKLASVFFCCICKTKIQKSVWSAIYFDRFPISDDSIVHIHMVVKVFNIVFINISYFFFFDLFVCLLYDFQKKKISRISITND